MTASRIFPPPSVFRRLDKPPRLRPELAMRLHQHVFSFLAFAAIIAGAADAPKALRVLLLTGGCCHDYGKQKDILKTNLEARAYVEVTQIHTDDKSTKPPLAILGNPDYAKGYDVVIHDECAADVNNPQWIKDVLAPHRAGIPGVNLHCAMHSYRIGDPAKKAIAGEERSAWFDYLGIQSSRHDWQKPIAIHYVNETHAITKGLQDWNTTNEELYNNVQVFPTATPLALGKQPQKQRDGTTNEVESVVVWINQYEKTRVFNTTIGHNNSTVSDPRYIELLARGLVWACNKTEKEYLKAMENKTLR
jgi:hypothetical protein